MIVVLFAIFGLKTYKDKTKFMVVREAHVTTAQDTKTYNWVRMGRVSRNQWRNEAVTCSRYGIEITRRSMRRHLELVNGVKESVFRYPMVGTVDDEVQFVTIKKICFLHHV